MFKFKKRRTRRELNPQEQAERVASQEQRAKKLKTCQICGRPILAEKGTIAHHGYNRPGNGWQTDSCAGARELPFENDHAALDRWIVSLQETVASKKALIAKIEAEELELVVREGDFSFDRRADRTRPRMEAHFTRANYDEVRAANVKLFASAGAITYDDFKRSRLHRENSDLKMWEQMLSESTKRRAGWKLTHVWRDKKWEAA